MTTTGTKPTISLGFIAWILLTTAIFLIPGIWLSTGTVAAAEVGTVEVDNLSLRTGPGPQYRVIAHLAKGTRVRVLNHQKGWLQVDHNGLQGFISDETRFVSLSMVNENGPDPSIGSGGESNGDPDGFEQQELKNLQQKAETLDEQLKASQSELAIITDKEKSVINELNSAEESLNRVRQRVHAAEAGLEKIEAQIEQMQNDYASLEKEIAANETHAAKRLVALYKLSWIGRVQLLATADSFFDFIQRKAGLEKILQQDEGFLAELNQDQTAIESVLEKLSAGKAEKRALELTLKKRMHNLEAEHRKRNGLLGKIRSEKKLAVAALASLQSAAEELDITLQQLRPRATTSSDQSAPNQSDVDPESPFNAHKGLLSWPVRGKILSFFGPYRDKKYNVTNFQRGIEIQAERGEPIRAVAGGYTIFAKWFKGFGNMMIIDHGDHYYTVYAHLEELFKVEGDRVEGGEVIATVGDSGSLTGPALHFEVRHRDKPLDPLEWINKG